MENMEKDDKFMKLDIQLFAEDGDGVGTPTENGEKGADGSSKNEKLYSRDEVNRMISAEKEKVRLEVTKEAEAKQTEAEKLARLDESEKLKYQLDQKTKEAEDWKGQVNALTLKDEASSYAREKGLPFEYIEDIDYAKENAESIKKRIDKLSDLRGKDLSNYLNEKLKQSPPKAVDNDKSKEDPYIQGFKNYNKNNKK